VSESSSDFVERARRFFSKELWSFDLQSGSLAGAGLRFLQFCVMVGEAFVRDNLLLRASALTYVTAIAVIPLLAVVIAVVGIFGKSDEIASMAVSTLAAGSPAAQERILELISQADIRGMGSIGAGVLFASSVLVLRHLETTLNFIWGVRRERSWMRRFADYLAVLIVAPIFLGAALSMAASFQAGPVLTWMLEFPTFAFLYKIGLSQIPKLLLLVGFSFVYWFFPDTRVKVFAALLGGLVAALLFSLAQTYYVGLNVGVARYNALFGGFAAIPLLLVWLFFCWAIVLLGAEISYAYQNLAHYRREAQEGPTGAAERELLATRIVVEVGRSFRDRSSAPGADELGDLLDSSVRTVRELLALLDGAGILSVRADGERSEAYQLGRPAEAISVSDILIAVRGQRTLEKGREHEEASAHRIVDELFTDLDGTLYVITDARSLADLLDAVEQAPAAGRGHAPDPVAGGVPRAASAEDPDRG